jgi:hypothetical protein
VRLFERLQEIYECAFLSAVDPNMVVAPSNPVKWNRYPGASIPCQDFDSFDSGVSDN